MKIENMLVVSKDLAVSPSSRFETFNGGRTFPLIYQTLYL